VNSQRAGALIFMAIGLLVLAIGGFVLWRAMEFDKRAVRVDAKVTEVFRQINQNSRETETVAVLEWTDASGVHSVKQWTDAYTTGQTLSVLVDPEDPTNVSAGGRGGPAVLLGVLGGAFLAIGLRALVRQARA